MQELMCSLEFLNSAQNELIGGGGGSFEFSLFSLGFKYPASAVHILFWL